MDPATLAIQHSLFLIEQSPSIPSSYENEVDKCAPPPTQEKKYASGFCVMQDLLAGGYVNVYNQATEKAQIDVESCLETVNERRTEFIFAPRRLKFREDLPETGKQLLEKANIPMEAELTLGELLSSIGWTDKTKPPLLVEATGEGAIHFLGFKGINGTFKKWGVDLENAYPELVYTVKEKFEKAPHCIVIEYYLERPQKNPDSKDEDPASSLIANLKDAVVDFIAGKLRPFSGPAEKEKENMDTAEDVMDPQLEGKSDMEKLVSILCTMGNYRWWLKDFSKIDTHLNRIVAGEFFGSHEVNPKRGSPEPFGGMTLHFEDGLNVILRFSYTPPPDMKLSAADLIHLPLLQNNQLIDLDAGHLHVYNCHLPQGLIDIIGGNRTPVLLDYSQTDKYLILGEWAGYLNDIVKGRTYRFAGMKNRLAAKVIDIAAQELKRNPKASLESVLEHYVVKTLEKMKLEDARIRNNPAHAALVLTLAACEALIDHISSAAMQDLIETMSGHWIELIKEETAFGAIARALKSLTPYPIISNYLFLAAYHSLEDGNRIEPLRAFLNLCGTESHAAPQPFENVIQLQLSHGSIPFSLMLPYRVQDAIFHLMDYPLKQRQYMSFLQEVLYIQKPPLDELEKRPLADIFFPDLEQFLPDILNRLLFLLSKYTNRNERIGIVQQFCFLLKAKNSLLSTSKSEKLDKVLSRILSDSSDRLSSYLFPILAFFGSFHDPVLNQPAFQIFKKLKNVRLKTDLALEFTKGHIRNAVKAFNWIVKETPEKKETQIELLLNICKTLRALPPEERMFHLDILAGSIEPFLPLENSLQVSRWLAQQFQQAGYQDLAKKAFPHVEEIITGQENDGLPSAKSPAQISSMSTLTREEVIEKAKQIGESKDPNRFYKLGNVLAQSDIQKMFSLYPEEWWDLILSPALINTSDLYLDENASIYIVCLHSLSVVSPTPKALSLFIECLNRDIQKTDLRKRLPTKLKKALAQHQSLLFKSLAENKMENAIVEAALCHLHRLPFHCNSLRYLLEAVDRILNNSANSQMIKSICELLNDSEIKKTFGENGHLDSLRSKIYSGIAMSLIESHFDLAYQYLQRACNLSKNLDSQLLLTFIEACKKQRKTSEFAWITQHVPKGNEKELQDKWQEIFKELFIALNPEEEMHSRDLEALGSLLQAPAFPVLLLNQSLALSLKEAMLNVKEHSLHYSKHLECALHIISLFPVDKSSILKFYKMLKSSADIALKERAWETLKTLKGLSNEEYANCWMDLLQGLKQSHSKKLIEVLLQPSQFSVFCLKNPKALEAYEIVFETLDHLWPQINTPEMGVKLKNAYRSLSTLLNLKTAVGPSQKVQDFESESLEVGAEHSQKVKAAPISSDSGSKDCAFRPDPAAVFRFKNASCMEVRNKIRISYTNCLSQSPSKADKNQAAALFLQIMKDHFGMLKEATEDPFPSKEIIPAQVEDKGPQWNEKLLICFKHILSNKPVKKDLLLSFINILEGNMQQEAGCLMISYLLQESGYSDLKSIGKLFKSLINASQKFSLKEFFDFKLFCQKVGFEKILEEMTVLVDDKLNWIAYQCTQLPGIKHLMQQGKVIDIAFRSHLNISKVLSNKWIFNKYLIDSILVSLPNYLIHIQEELLNELLEEAYHLCTFGYNIAGLFDEYVLKCEAFNKILNSWTTEELDSQEVLCFSKPFYVFAKSIIRTIFRMPLEEHYAKVFIFISSMLRKGWGNPSNINDEFLEILLQFCFILNENTICTYPQELKMILVIFREDTLAFFKEHPLKNKKLCAFEKVLRLYYNQPQPSTIEAEPQKKLGGEAVNIFYNTSSHEVINAVNDLLNFEPSEIAFKLAYQTMKAYIAEAIRSFPGLFRLMKKMSKYNASLNSINQAENFCHIAEVHRLFSTFATFRDGKAARPYQLYQEAGLTNFKQMVKSISKTPLNHWHHELLLITFPQMACMSAKILTGKNYSIFENSLKIHMNCCKSNLLRYERLDNNFKKIARSFAGSLIDLDPPPKQYPKTRESLFKSWIEILRFIGREIHQEKPMEWFVLDLEATAVTRGIYTDFENAYGLFIREAVSCLNQFESADEQFEKIAISVLDLLTNRANPPKNFHLKRSDLFKNWIEILLDMGSKRSIKVDSLVVKMISQSLMKGGVYSKDFPIPEDLKKIYLNLLQNGQG